MLGRDGLVPPFYSQSIKSWSLLGLLVLAGLAKLKTLVKEVSNIYLFVTCNPDYTK